jgi:putative ABC transport system permease protein
VCGYYFDLALRNLRRNLGLTLLTLVLVGAGVGCFTFSFTTLRVMSSDPIPDKSSVLFMPQLGSDDPHDHNPSGRLPDSLVYRDALELMRVHRGIRQTAIFPMQLEISTPSHLPLTVAGQAVYADFFPMFQIPFRSGSPWSQTEDRSAANVVVLSANLADRLYPEGDSIGKEIDLQGHSYRIIGVLNHWNPLPRFYDPWRAFSLPEDLYIPFSAAVAKEIDDGEDYVGCLPPSLGATGGNYYRALLNSGCFHTRFWVELPTPASVEDFRSFLGGYITQQHQLGRFPGTPRTGLLNVREWLIWAHVVPNEVLLRTYLAVGFLIVCLVNAAGLILAQLSRRATELSVRRAMGASRLSLYWQIGTESALVGCIGGLLGLGLASLALAIERAALSQSAGDLVLSHLTHMDTGVVLMTFGVGVLTAMGAALYPAWQVSHTPPARQLKVQ